MEIRRFTTGDLRQSIALRNYNFRSPYTEQKAKDYECLFAMADGLGAFDLNGKLLGQVLNLPMAYNFYGESISTVGVNYVAVLPEARGQGVASELMIKSLVQANERGQILSMLMPFSVSFYRKFGFDLMTQRIHYTVTPDHYPTFKPDNEVTFERFLLSEMTVDRFDLIRRLYDTVEMQVNGTLLRTEKWWTRQHYQYPNLNYVLIWHAGECLGYLSYQIDQTTLRVSDFIAKNRLAEEELWNFIVAHRASIFTIHGQTTPAKDVGYGFQDPRIEMRIQKDTMVRIVNVEAFLTKWYAKFPSETAIEITVTDKYGPWNEGTYRINGSTVRKSANEATTTRQAVDVRELAAIFIGPLTSTQLKKQLNQQKQSPLSQLIDSAKDKEWAHFLGDF